MPTEEERGKTRLRNQRHIEERRRDPEVRSAWAAYMREYRQRNLERVRELDRKRYKKYRAQRNHANKVRRLGVRLTLEEYELLVNAQGGVCALCHRVQHPLNNKLNLDIDHDHETGRVRALLCSMCNRGMGLFGDDPDLLEKAVAYLRDHQGRTSGSP